MTIKGFDKLTRSCHDRLQGSYIGQQENRLKQPHPQQYVYGIYELDYGYSGGFRYNAPGSVVVMDTRRRCVLKIDEHTLVYGICNIILIL